MRLQFSEVTSFLWKIHKKSAWSMFKGTWPNCFICVLSFISVGKEYIQKKYQWNNKSIYTHMFSVKLQLIVILFCYEVYSKVFLNPKRGILYHKRGANEKANTHGLHLLRGGFWWSTRKWKANKEIKTVYTSEKLYLLKTEMFTDLNARPLITIYEFLEKKNWNMTWAWIWKPCRENVFYNKTKCNR